jgi:hypothetical protein
VVGEEWRQQDPLPAGAGAARIFAMICCAPAAISHASELMVTNWKPLTIRFSAASGLPV